MRAIKRCSQKANPRLKAEANPRLSGKGDAHSRAPAEEVAQGAGGRLQLAQAPNGPRQRAGGVEAKRGGIAQVVDRGGESGDVVDKVVAGVRAVEQVEEFHERPQGHSLAESKLAADAKIHLIERLAAELVQARLHAVHHGAVVGAQAVTVQIYRGGHGEGTRAFELRKHVELEPAWQLQSACDHQAMANVLARRSVVAGAKRVADIADTVDEIEQLTDRGAPGGGAGQGVVGGKIEAPREVVLHHEGNAVVPRAIIGAEQRDVRRRLGQCRAAYVFIAPVLVDALLMFVVHVDAPDVAQRALDADAGLERVWRVIVGIDHGALFSRRKQSPERRIDGAEGVHPAVLGQVVVIQTKPGAHHRLPEGAGGVSDSDSWSKRDAIIMRNPWRKRNPK